MTLDETHAAVNAKVLAAMRDGATVALFIDMLELVAELRTAAFIEGMRVQQEIQRETRRA